MLAAKATVSVALAVMTRGPRKLAIKFGAATLTHYGGVIFCIGSCRGSASKMHWPLRFEPFSETTVTVSASGMAIRSAED